jgi:hypothetical protein
MNDVGVVNIKSVSVREKGGDDHPFKSLRFIRTFIESLKGQTINQDKNKLVWGQLQTLLSKHPTWKDKLDTVESFMITTGFNKTCTVLKIKPAWSKKFITISWRKCKPTRVPKTKVSESDEKQPSVSHASHLSTAVDETKSADETKIAEIAEIDVNPPTSSLTPQLSGAMRSAIGRQVASWKQANQVFRRCRKCQSPLNLHVDHVIPFVQLQRDFLKLQPEIPTSFFYMRKTCQPRFTDKGFARKWQFYHRKHAQLQWLCRTCNLKKGSSDSVRS